VALKHYTSKLATYDDLGTLKTFGFRGEALSSLCALSDFTITTCTAEEAPKGTKLDFKTSGHLSGTSVVAAQKGTTVTVENLFNNLPVRRQELQRNIKREWNKVINVLGQYGCIQTGVKITVTHQPAKGKKTPVFATKGNPTTRENIANVFGAKTLAALIPLDLKLELEPTNGPSQRWGTQGGGDSKEIRIVGHISKPISGEGRQTPDRQMFFVNSRPCGLPQVAKAFNEVYKSYNNTQSPFIFANIEMDTHLYDVNVSPDKRTIMLHEQTRMLEELKVCLTEMFERQDYTVPISQLPAQRTPVFKQLTITPARSAPPATRESIEEARDQSLRSRSASEDRSMDEDEERPMKVGNDPRVVGVLQDSMNGDRDAVSLISRWHGNKTGDRRVPTIAKPKPPVELANGLSKDKLKLIEKFSKERERAQTADSAEETDDDAPESTADTLVASYHLPVPIQDFNARIAEAELTKRRAEQQRESDAERFPVFEGPIPAVLSPVRRGNSAIKNVISRNVRPRRMSEEEATITIGNHTITSSIGTPCPKKRRVETPSTNATSRGSSTAFRSRLTQRFAAPGTNVGTAETSADGEEEEDEEEQEDEAELEGIEPSPPSESDEADAEMPERGNVEESIAEEDITEGNFGQEFDNLDDPSMQGACDGQDDDYIDEEEKKAQEDAKVQETIKAAEEDAARPSEDNAKRANSMLKGGARRKDATVHLVKNVSTNADMIATQLSNLTAALEQYQSISSTEEPSASGIDSATAEEKLSLTIHKSDFAKMKIVGQFNLGFILAVRASSSSSSSTSDSTPATSDDLFIIDQHASDEKYNFERLQASTTVQSQRLVRPKPLSLTAVEEEIVIEHLPALEANGFIVSISPDAPVGSRCHLVSLPLSRETTFSLSDLDELVTLLADAPQGQVPRPSKVRRMFAMRACRSSVMIGRTLTSKQMGRLVCNMGEIEKPWNCPHGRPTMRHLAALGAWEGTAWREGDGVEGEGKGVETDWAGYVRRKREGN
jgi:DNA mismatch repair protein PMS2